MRTLTFCSLLVVVVAIMLNVLHVIGFIQALGAAVVGALAAGGFATMAIGRRDE